MNLLSYCRFLLPTIAFPYSVKSFSKSGRVYSNRKRKIIFRKLSAESEGRVPSESSSALSGTTLHQITWESPNGFLNFTARDGELLRTAALRQGVVSPHNGRANVINCRGLGTCGTCAVEVQGDIFPKTRNSIEAVRLSCPPGHGSSREKPLRLACQVQVKGDLVVTKRTGFWGQFDDMAHPTVPSLPFGDLEYVLDMRSPTHDKE